MVFNFNKLFSVALLVVFSFLLFGCNVQQGKLETFNEYYGIGDYARCSDLLGKQISQRKKPGTNDLLWALQAGSVKRVQGDYAGSNRFFDQAEAAMKHFDLNQSQILDNIGATAVNDTVIPYLGHEYDGVMLNTYKGLNFMTQNNMEMARVEFNRALDRQRRAKGNFNKEIKDLRSSIDSRSRASNDVAIRQSVDNPEVNQILSDKYPDLSSFEVYPDFINPFATYMSGLFFNLDGDYNKGVDLMKESYGMVPENKFIAEDLAETELALSNNRDIEGVCWVIFENGLGPLKNIWRVDIPIYFAESRIKYAGIALPKLSYRNRSYSHLIVTAGEKKYSTEIVADIDRVVQTEFKQQYPSIVSRAVVSAAIKAAGQYAFDKEDSSKGSLASMLTAVYSYATTTADVRVWTALPKDFQVVRFDIPDNRKITVHAPGNHYASQSAAAENFPLEIELGGCKNAVIYVKVIKAGVAPVYNVMLF